MAQYKVPQNVESEDKIIGPLTLRQFIYVIIAIMWAVLMWRIFIKTPLLILATAFPVTGVFLALGLIQREEQSFENYFIAIIRFLIVPRRRVWHKEPLSAAENSMIVTPPPKPEPSMHHRNPEQVRGQLEKLALIIDTRGRVPKPASIQLPDEQNAAAAMSARVNVGAAEQAHADTNQVTQADDILDMQNNDAAKNVGQMLAKAEAEVHDQAVATMQGSRAQNSSPQTPVQHASDDDILNITANSGGLSVAQVAAAASRASGNVSQNQLVENQSVKLRS